MLSYMEPIWFKTTMRKPDPAELEFVFLLFLLALPMGYWMLRTVLAFLGI